MYTNLYTTDVVTSNQYNYHQHPLSTTLAACTLTFTPPMWLLLIQLPSTPTIYNTGGVYTNLYTTDVVTSNQYNYHQHPLSTALVACTLTFPLAMWLLLIQLPSTPTIYNTRGVYINLYTTDVVTSKTTTINTHYLQHSRPVH